MRASWRFLLLRSSNARSSSTLISSHLSHFQLSSHHPRPNLHALGSVAKGLHSLVPHLVLSPYPPPNTGKRCFSSEPTLEPTDPDHALFVNLFSKEISDQEIKTQLESSNVVITQDLVSNALRSLSTSPVVASRVFDWVLKHDGGRLGSKSYNLMLGILGVSGSVKKFWHLFRTMKKKGYGVSKDTFPMVLEKFEKEGWATDLEILRGIYASGSIDNSDEKKVSHMCEIIRQEVWSDDVEQQLKGFNVAFSDHLVGKVLENLALEPTKALIFFRWVEESGLFKHNEQTYNSMARILGREDCIDRFWNVVDESRSLGYEMEAATFDMVSRGFAKRKMMKDLVDLYEFAMGGANKPLFKDCTFILRTIVEAKDLDMDLFSSALRAFVKGGNALPDSAIDAVLRSLTSVRRSGESEKILEAVAKGGVDVSVALRSKIAFGVSSAGGKNTAELVNLLEETGGKLDYKTWTSLIKGLCVAGNLDEASACFHKMQEREGPSSAGSAFDSLVDAYCQKDQSLDAYKILTDQVTERQLKPWCTTYKTLIDKLLVRGNLNEALNLLGMMKRSGFPPYVGPFIEHVSKSGNGDDAIVFLKAMTWKKFPSKPVFLRVFNSFFEQGRLQEAQNFLSKCPGYIRNDADVLNLFFSAKSRQGDSITGVHA